MQLTRKRNGRELPLTEGEIDLCAELFAPIEADATKNAGLDHATIVYRTPGARGLMDVTEITATFVHTPPRVASPQTAAPRQTEEEALEDFFTR